VIGVGFVWAGSTRFARVTFDGLGRFRGEFKRYLARRKSPDDVARSPDLTPFVTFATFCANFLCWVNAFARVRFDGLGRFREELKVNLTGRKSPDDVARSPDLTPLLTSRPSVQIFFAG
jgi:hypothetical protein